MDREDLTGQAFYSMTEVCTIVLSNLARSANLAHFNDR